MAVSSRTRSVAAKKSTTTSKSAGKAEKAMSTAARKGALMGRTQIKNPATGEFVRRDEGHGAGKGRFLDIAGSGGKFKGVVAGAVQRGHATARAHIEASRRGAVLTVPFNVPNHADSRQLHRHAVLLRGASPVDRMQAERAGVDAGFLKRFAKRLGIDYTRMFEIVGVPKATAEKKVANNEAIAGAPGQAALGLVRLLGMADEIVAQSTATEAENFDTAKWLGRWLELPQPALGGRKPADVMDTPTGVAAVAQILGAIESGAYL